MTEMTLPAYAEELKRLVDDADRLCDDGNKFAHAIFPIGLHAHTHLDRILRDAEIAEAARELVTLNELHKDATKPYRKIAALIAKETP